MKVALLSADILQIYCHISPQAEVQGLSVRKVSGLRDQSIIANPYAMKCFIKKCLHIVALVWEHTMMENDQ